MPLDYMIYDITSAWISSSSLATMAFYKSSTFFVKYFTMIFFVASVAFPDVSLYLGKRQKQSSVQLYLLQSTASKVKNVIYCTVQRRSELPTILEINGKNLLIFKKLNKVIFKQVWNIIIYFPYE